jgi:hypothetical protein
MKFLILILSINFLAIYSADVEARRANFKPESHRPPSEPCTKNCKPEPPEHKCKDCYPTCKEKCKCVPDVETVAYTPIKELKVTENSILVCGPGTKIKRLEVLNEEYKYNVTCSGIVARKKKLSEAYITAIFAKTKGKVEEEEAIDIDIKDYYAISHFNQASEIFWQRSIIKNTECAGDVLISSGQWVVEDPINGCCSEGVNHWIGVHYTIEIIGKCCTTCFILQSSYASHEVLTNQG